MRGLGTMMVAALVLLAPLSVADTIEQEVGDHTVTVTYLDEEQTHSESDTDTSSSTFDQTVRRNGAWLDGEGVEATLTTYESSYRFDNGAAQVSNDQRGAHLTVEGEAAGVTTQQTLQATLIEVHLFFGPNDWADAHTALITYEGNTAGHGVQVFRHVTSAASVGQLGSNWLNPNPTLGTIVFATTSTYSHGTVGAGPVVLGDQVAPSVEGYTGDYTAIKPSGSVFVARCFEGVCTGEGTAFAECLVGLRPPFFLVCR